MRHKITHFAFWLSDFWAGMLCVFCLCGGLAFPFVIPVYERMNKLETQGITVHILISSALLLVAYMAHRVRQRSLFGLVFLFIAITTFSVIYKGLFLWLSLVPIILLPYILTGCKLLKNHGSV